MTFCPRGADSAVTGGNVDPSQASNKQVWDPEDNTGVIGDERTVRCKRRGDKTSALIGRWSPPRHAGGSG